MSIYAEGPEDEFQDEEWPGEEEELLGTDEEELDLDELDDFDEED